VRRWLTLYALSITSIVILAFLVPLAVLVADLAEDRAMSAAEREAQTVARYASTIDGTSESIVALEEVVTAVSRTSVQLSDGSVIGVPMPERIDLTAAIERGHAYQQSLDDGRAVVVPVLRGEDRSWVVVLTVPASALTQNVTSAWVILGMLGLALIGLSFIVADRMGRAVVTPITDLVDATHRLGQGELSVEVDPGGPSELAEVGAAFNTLTGQVTSLMDRERETAADLSHRLRTPLTALKLDIEALGDNVDVSRLQRDVDELERIVGHVISEARRSVREHGTATSDLAGVVKERLEYWGSLAEDQARAWTLDVGDGTYLVSASATDVEAMLDALLGNIFSHTPAGTAYSVTLNKSSGGLAELVVSDTGAGIADESLLERGESGANSTGLGADIVRSTAIIAGGTAQWNVGASSGTVVRVILPLLDVAR